MLRCDKATFTENKLHFRNAAFAYARVVVFFQIESLPVVTRMSYLTIQLAREN